MSLNCKLKQKTCKFPKKKKKKKFEQGKINGERWSAEFGVQKGCRMSIQEETEETIGIVNYWMDI